MSERDTMFNERDRRCAAVQLMLSTDPNYDNRTTARTLKMQKRTVQHAQGDEKQDSAPAYKSKKIQAWLQKECYDFVIFSHWPPSYPDMNPLDYFVWSCVENINNKTSQNTKGSLIASIRRVFAELPPALVKKVCSQFRVRIEAVIEAEGDYIE